MGVILFIMLCALMPYRDESIALLKIDQRRPLRFPKGVNINQEVKTLLDSILNVKVRKRPTCTEILDSPWLQQDSTAAMTSARS